jgi:hypothetical protein
MGVGVVWGDEKKILYYDCLTLCAPYER